jgi:hypothetical protein
MDDLRPASAAAAPRRPRAMAIKATPPAGEACPSCCNPCPPPRAAPRCTAQAEALGSAVLRAARPLDTFGRSRPAAVLICNSNALWEPFVASLAALPAAEPGQAPGWQQGVREGGGGCGGGGGSSEGAGAGPAASGAAAARAPGPLDAYCRGAVSAALERACPGVRHDARWADTMPGDPAFVDMLLAATAGGSGMAAMCAALHLAVHPEVGPWFAVRALVSLDLDLDLDLARVGPAGEEAGAQQPQPGAGAGDEGGAVAGAGGGRARPVGEEVEARLREAMAGMQLQPFRCARRPKDAGEGWGVGVKGRVAKLRLQASVAGATCTTHNNRSSPFTESPGHPPSRSLVYCFLHTCWPRARLPLRTRSGPGHTVPHPPLTSPNPCTHATTHGREHWRNWVEVRRMAGRLLGADARWEYGCVGRGGGGGGGGRGPGAFCH